MFQGPTVNQVLISEALQSFAISHVQSSMWFVARRFFPLVRVRAKKGTYIVHSVADWNRDEMQPRAPGTLPVSVGHQAGQDEYNCSEKALRHLQPDEVRDSYPNMAMADAAGARFATNLALIASEVSFANDFVTPTTVWGTNTDITATSTTWSDPTAQPIDDCDVLKDAIEDKSVQPVNTALFTQDKWIEFKNHPNVRNRLQDNRDRRVDFAKAADLLDVERVLIMRARYNTAPEGQPAAMAKVATDRVLMAYVDPMPSIDTATAGKTFIWDQHEMSDAEGAPIIELYRHPDPGMKSRLFQATRFDDQKLTDANSGGVLYNI